MSRDKVKRIVDEIADKYHFTAIDGELEGKYFPNNLVLMSLSYILDGNHLLIGDPGWGKTTSAQLIASKFSGIPFDLYEALTVEGHPGLFTEKWKARPDYGQLAKGEERVIWQGAFGLDAFIVDEISRVSYDVQDEMLEGIRTGVWKYLNDVLHEGKKPTFLTTNDRDNGNGEIIPPFKDRIYIVTEEKVQSPLNNYKAAQDNIRKNLTNPQVTAEALQALRKLNFSEFKKIVERNKMADHITREEKMAIQDNIDKIPFENDANYFLWNFASEINYSQKYGTKRARDPISDDAHDKNYIGVHVQNSFSARPMMAARLYAKGLAWILGNSAVKLDHVRYILPFISAHKLGFRAGFKDKHGNDTRNEYEDLFLAKKLVMESHDNYDRNIKPIRNLVASIQSGDVEDLGNGRVRIGGQEKIVSDFDQPFIRHLIDLKILGKKSNW